MAKKPSDLDELFKGYTEDYKCSEYDFGDDIGREKICKIMY